jgi:hypothetical protein
MKTFIELARSQTELARKAREEKRIVDAAMLYTSSPLTFLSIAIESDFESGREFLKKENLPTCLAEGVEASNELLLAIRAKRFSAAMITGRYVFIALTYIAVIVDEQEKAKDFIGIAESGEVPGTPFWDTYSRCLSMFLNKQPFTAPVIALKPAEKHWFPYIELMSLLSKGEAGEKKIEELRALFMKRNVNKRFINYDAHQIEGNPLHPAKWDFALEALLKLNNKN